MIKIFVKFTCFSRRFRHRSAHQHIKTWVFSEKCILVDGNVCVTVLKELIRNQWEEKGWIVFKEGGVNCECGWMSNAGSTAKSDVMNKVNFKEISVEYWNLCIYFINYKINIKHEKNYVEMRKYEKNEKEQVNY